MVHGEVAGLKNGEPVMAGVLEEDHRDKITEKPAELKKIGSLELRLGNDPKRTDCKTLSDSVPFISRSSRAKQNCETKGREHQLQAKIGRN